MQVRPKRILWPTDFSAVSLRAAPYARALCETFGSELHVIHVAQPLILSEASVCNMTRGEKISTVPDVTGGEIEALRILVKRRFARLGSVKKQVLAGDARHAICDYAAREKIDLIVMATHGCTGLKRLLMGSVAEHIVRTAPCAVLTVKSFPPELLDKEARGTKASEMAASSQPSSESAHDSAASLELAGRR